MKIKNILSVFILTIILVNCIDYVAMDYEYPIYIKNNADHHIGSYFATGSNFGRSNPDSLPETDIDVCYDIEIDSGIPDYVITMPLKHYFKQLPHEILTIYIFHTDTLYKYSWEEIRERQMILRRYDLSLDDLRRMHFLITYP